MSRWRRALKNSVTIATLPLRVIAEVVAVEDAMLAPPRARTLDFLTKNRRKRFKISPFSFSPDGSMGSTLLLAHCSRYGEKKNGLLKNKILDLIYHRGV